MVIIPFKVWITLGASVIDLKTTFIGASKVAVGNRITLVIDAAKELGVKVGDKVVFEKDGSGRLIIRKG